MSNAKRRHRRRRRKEARERKFWDWFLKAKEAEMWACHEMFFAMAPWLAVPWLQEEHDTQKET